MGLLGLVFYLGYRSSPEQDLLLSAHRFLNAPGSRWVPVWGWTKGVLLYAMEGNRPMAAALFSLSLLLLLALALLARRLPADYYEATLNRTQTVARLVEGWNREGAAQLIGMLEKPGRVTEREGFSFGSGGSVYFFKVLYNRFCFSRWGVFTRTGITYLITAVAAGLFDRAFLDESIVYLPTLVLAVLIFFRTVASPVSVDIRKASFLLQPDPIWVKLFYSVLGGTVNCALDSAIPLMAGTAAAGFSPLLGLAYLPVLAGADFFAANAGAFVDVSLPASIGTAFRQLIQILLLYLGVIFDGMLLVSGIADGHAGTGFLLVCGMNLLLGAFFLGLTGVWLYPSRGRMTPSEDRTPDRVGARRVSSRLGLALSVMFLAIHVGQGVLAKALPARPILSVYLPIYAVGFPLFLLCMRPRPEGNTGEKRVLGAGKLLLMIPVCFFVMYGGNVIGLALQGLVTAIKPFAFQLPQPAALPGEQMALQAVLLVIASPLMEELVFRRCLMDRLRPYGERAALFGSALLFGLFHAAVSQVCYAALLGLVFGYVYLRTGRLRYSLFLHMLINALTAVMLPFLLTRVTDAVPLSGIGRMSVAAAFRLPGVLPLLAYLTLLFVLFLFGGVLFLFGLREEELSPDTVRLKDVLFTPGMGVFLAAAGLWLIGG